MSIAKLGLYERKAAFRVKSPLSITQVQGIGNSSISSLVTTTILSCFLSDSEGN